MNERLDDPAEFFRGRDQVAHTFFDGSKEKAEYFYSALPAFCRENGWSGVEYLLELLTHDGWTLHNDGV